MDILKTAKEEASRLKEALSHNPDYQKLQQVLRLIETYEALANINKIQQKLPVKMGMARPSEGHPPQLRYGSKLAAVDAAVAAHLEKIGVRASSGELLPVVTAAGIEMTGRVPARTLSSFLTMSKRFNNVRGFGYGLYEWGESLGPKADSRLSGQQETTDKVVGHEERNIGIDAD